jgi:hypothetical protein
MQKKLIKIIFFLLKKKTYKVVKAYRMIRLNMDMMINEMMLVKMMNNQMMNNQNHREVNLVLVMMDTYMMIEIVALLIRNDI